MKRKTTQDKRKQIMDAATTVIAKEGFHNAKTAQIAREAGIAEGTIYRHFKSKEDLFFAIVDQGMNNLKDMILVRIKKEISPLEKLKEIIRTYLRFFEKNRDFYSILIHERSEFQERVKKKYFQHYYVHINKIREVFREGIRKGQIKKIDVKSATNLFANALSGLVYMWVIEGGKYSLSRKLPLIFEIFFTGVVKGEKERAVYG